MAATIEMGAYLVHPSPREDDSYPNGLQSCSSALLVLGEEARGAAPVTAAELIHHHHHLLLLLLLLHW